MNALTEQSRRLLEMLQDGTLSSNTPAEVARKLGWDVEQTTDLLADLHVAGWIVVHEFADRITVSLSSHAVERFEATVPTSLARPVFSRWQGWTVPVAAATVS